MSRLFKHGERDPDELIPDFDWVRKVTILVTYDSETDTVLIDRGPLGPTMVEAILGKALEEPNFTDDPLVAVDSEDEED